MSYDGSIKIDTSLNTAGFNNGMKSMVGGLGKLTTALGITIGIAAGFQFLRTGEIAARSLSTALSGLGFVTQANGRDFGQAKAFINEYISDGLVPATDAIEAYKNMVSRGYDTSQIEDMMNIMKDSAVYNRQSAFSIGESISKATQGLRMENSLLTDSVGIQKNVAMMWKEYAAEIGTTANNLTIVQKRQAEYNGFMKEGGIFAGAAAEYINTYAGKLSQLSAGFTNLKVAVGNSVIPIINAVLPAINAAVAALTRLFNRIAVIMQVLFGYDPSTNVAAYEQSMSNVASSTQDAADAQDELAENTEAAGKAAKGALASFDRLDVLQQKDTGTEGANGTEIPTLSDASMTLPAVDTTAADESLDSFRNKVEGIKKSLANFFAPFSASLAELVTAYSRVWSAMGRALAPLLTDPNVSGFVTAIRDGVIVVLNLLADVLNWIADWIDKNPEKFRAFVSVLALVAVAFLMITNPVAMVIGIITLLLAAIGLLAKNWETVKKIAIDTWQSIKEAFGTAAEWIQTKVTDPIKEAFGTALDWVKTKWESIFTGVKDFVKGAINSVIDYINGMIRAIAIGINTVVNALNSLKINIPSWVPIYGGKSWGMNIPTVPTPQIPRLATGAVIPPNVAFAAILGDQKSGRNLEAPESLIRQIVREETQGMSGAQDVSVTFNGTMGELIRVLRPEIKKEDRRTGKSLIVGV